MKLKEARVCQNDFGMYLKTFQTDGGNWRPVWTSHISDSLILSDKQIDEIERTGELTYLAENGNLNILDDIAWPFPNIRYLKLDDK